MSTQEPKTAAFGIPPELTRSIVEHLPLSSLNALARTDKKTKTAVEEQLYASVNIAISSQLPSLLSSIDSEPQRASYIRSLRLPIRIESQPDASNNTPSILERIFSKTLSRLSNLEVEGEHIRYDPQPDSLISAINNQPSLESIYLWATGSNDDYYADPPFPELNLIANPNLRRLTLDNYALDPSILSPSSTGAFKASRPFHLRLWRCDHTMENLSSFLEILGNVTSFSVFHPDGMYRRAWEQKSREFSAWVEALETVRGCLDRLTMDWEGLWEQAEEEEYEDKVQSASLGRFESLTYLRISPQWLKAIGKENEVIITLKERMPPRLKVLALESINLDDWEDDEDIYSHGPLLRPFLENVKVVAPNLEELVLHMGDDMDVPDKVAELATRAGLKLVKRSWLSDSGPNDSDW